MGIWGKIVGGVAGFAVGGPLGALLGAVAGHAYDSLRGDQRGEDLARLGGPRVAERESRQAVFSVAVIVLGAKMAKVDGAVTRAEVNAFKEVFRIRGEDIKSVARIFDVAKADAAGFEPYARQVAELFHHEPAVLEELLAGLFHIAQADGAIRPAELGYLRQVAAIFGVGTAGFERVRATFVRDAEPDPYQVLGLSRAAGDDEIKQTYRRLIRENHPDALVAKGMPPDFVSVANQRMAAINAAYDQIARERGLK